MRSVVALLTLVAVAILASPPASANAGDPSCVTILTSESATGTSPILSVGTDQIVVGVQENVVGQEAVAIVLAPALCGVGTLALP
jgi:hypothetical protein